MLMMCIACANHDAKSGNPNGYEAFVPYYQKT